MKILLLILLLSPTSSFANLSCAKLIETQTSKSSRLFSPSLQLKFSIKAPFEQLFQDKQDRDKKIIGDLIYTNENGQTVSLQIQLKVRGQTSRNQEFPKLKIKFLNKDQIKGTLFEGNRKIKLFTHGYNEDTDEVIRLGQGRNLLKSSQAVNRVATIYEFIHPTGVIASDQRRAEITYIDTSLQSETVMTKPALLIEDLGKLADRHGLQEIETKPKDGEEPDKWSPEIDIQPKDIVRFHLSELLVGNFDWKFPVRSRDPKERSSFYEIHNVSLIGNPLDPLMPEASREILPVIEDFDMSLSVVGVTDFLRTLSPLYFPGESDSFRWTAWNLHLISQKLGFEKIVAELQHFRNIKKQITEIIEKAQIDEQGRLMLLEQVTHFYRAIQAENMNMPLLKITGDGVHFFTSPDSSTTSGFARRPEILIIPEKPIPTNGRIKVYFTAEKTYIGRSYWSAWVSVDNVANLKNWENNKAWAQAAIDAGL